MKQYFVAEPGASPHGPYDEAMVKSACEQRMYPPGTKVWWEGATQWELVELVFGKGAPDVVPSPPSAITPDIGNKEPKTGGSKWQDGMMNILLITGIIAGNTCFSIWLNEMDVFHHSIPVSLRLFFLPGCILGVVIGVIALICKGIRKAYKFIRK